MIFSEITDINLNYLQDKEKFLKIMGYRTNFSFFSDNLFKNIIALALMETLYDV